MVTSSSSMMVGGLRRRDARYRASPAQTRTWRFPASGSSVVLTDQADRHSCPLHGPVVIARSELASCCSLLSAGTSFLCELRTPVGSLRLRAGFPDLRLPDAIHGPIRHLDGMRRTPAYLPAPCSTTPPERTPPACEQVGPSPVRVPAQSVSWFHLVQEPSRLPE